MTTTDLEIAVTALVVALAATPVARVVAVHAGVVDRPGPLKPQDAAVPYLGGLAVLAAVVVGAAVGRPAVLVPLALAAGLGVADDRFDLPPPARLAGQVLVGVLVAATVDTRLGVLPGWVAIVFVTLVLVNGVNFLDGLDMLAAGTVAVAAVGFAVLLGGDGRDLAVALAAGLAGFLVYNRPPATIYLGDGGSYLLGTALTALLAWSWAPGVPTAKGVAAVAVVAVPAAEVVFAVVRRRRGGGSLLSGDRRHPYDLLVRRGWPRFAASLAYIAAEAVVVVVAVVTSRNLAAAVTTVVALAAALLLAAALGGALTPDEPEGAP